MIYSVAIPAESITSNDVSMAEIRELARGIHMKDMQMADPGAFALKLFLLLHMADEDLRNLIIDIAIDYFFTQSEHYEVAQTDFLKGVVETLPVKRKHKTAKKRG